MKKIFINLVLLLAFTGISIAADVQPLTKAELRRQLNTLNRDYEAGINALVLKYWQNLNSINSEYITMIDSLRKVIIDTKDLRYQDSELWRSQYYNMLDSLNYQIDILKTLNRDDINALNDIYHEDMEQLHINYNLKIDELRNKYDRNIDSLRERIRFLYDSTISKHRLYMDKMRDEKRLLEDKYYFMLDSMKQTLADTVRTLDKVIREEERLKLAANLRYAVPIATISFSDHYFFNQNNRIATDHSFGLRLSLNSGKLIGLWKYLDIWAEYINPNIKTSTTAIEKWQLDMFNIGFSLNLPNVLDYEKFLAGMRFEYAHSWAEGQVYNNYNSDFRMNAESARIEFNAMNPTWETPVQFFVAMQVYHKFSDDLFFYSNNQTINFGRTPISLNFGLRLLLWRTGEYQFDVNK